MASGEKEETNIVRIDGRTLEGGGQLVRNALALSALTSIPVTIDHIRGNRKGKTGLKGSHTAAVKFLAEICGGQVLGARVGSSQITFYPQGRLNEPCIKPEYTIQQSTPGSIFLVFQALYPYLLYAGARTHAHWPIRLNVTGGTNVSFSPSYDYIAQVLVPNLEKLGLPHLSVNLNRRGWGTGPLDLGSVTFEISPLTCGPTKDATNSHGPKLDRSIPKFPSFSIRRHRRGTITRIEVTILAPEIPLPIDDILSDSDPNTARRRSRTTGTYTVRSFLQAETCRGLADALASLPSHLFSNSDNRIPVKIHISEATGHPTRLYVLLVAHTSTGFRLGRDALLDGRADSEDRQHRSSHSNSSKDSMRSRIQRMIDRCITDFMEELQPAEGPGDEDSTSGPDIRGISKEKSCVDVFMRDQLVIFEALGKLQNTRDESGTLTGIDEEIEEDEHSWSMHTRTAMWVCEQFLGAKV
ncbi:putative RNA 3'-terminal phosphate cyclase [Paecilomyces variotii]|uniref:Putative RNA 3'-terminal phosphate cyclase n=1 Tax=Byssochlamys spectabilis TaxID=264951 RepID=A0A443HWI6_BYSSP|nr:putative RNA 3'-terminal phosphate cyclase [Paecilomyces variotii]RWQ96185.1 putative RNA 3'-terminal phosphate cyclase [Paecilomyces variotii]